MVAYAIDRPSRDPVHLGVVLSEADHHGARIEFVSEPLDESPEDQLIRFVRGYAAKLEHAKLVERAMRGRGGLVWHPASRWCPGDHSTAIAGRRRHTSVMYRPCHRANRSAHLQAGSERDILAENRERPHG